MFWSRPAALRLNGCVAGAVETAYRIDKRPHSSPEANQLVGDTMRRRPHQHALLLGSWSVDLNQEDDDKELARSSRANQRLLLTCCG
jgi:hypothetical protein